MAYSESIVIRSCASDIRGFWKPSAIMEALQDAAIGHCEANGLARGVTDAMGVIWVLSRCRVEMDALPRDGERVSVETWATPPRHLFYRRASVIRDAAGAPVGSAQAYWLLLDPNTRRAVTNDEVARLLSPVAQDPPAHPPCPIRLPQVEPSRERFTPPYTDFDINGHVNNTRYLDWCWNALGFDALSNRQIAVFDVNYEREILPGEAVDAELYLDADAFAYVARVNGARCFSASGTLRHA